MIIRDELSAHRHKDPNFFQPKPIFRSPLDSRVNAPFFGGRADSEPASKNLATTGRDRFVLDANGGAELDEHISRSSAPETRNVRKRLRYRRDKGSGDPNWAYDLPITVRTGPDQTGAAHRNRISMPPTTGQLSRLTFKLCSNIGRPITT